MAEGGAAQEDDGVLEDLKRFGAPPEVIAAVENRGKEETETPILPENETAVRLMALCSTQWNYAGITGTPIGLDYPAVEATARMARFEMSEGLLRDLKVMEAEILLVLRKR